MSHTTHLSTTFHAARSRVESARLSVLLPVVLYVLLVVVDILIIGGSRG